jgi:nucleotide-binding universal stress UspA family protein
LTRLSAAYDGRQVVRGGGGGCGDCPPQPALGAPKTDAQPRVVLALDGSAAAATALPFARSVADDVGATLEIVCLVSAAGRHADARKWVHVDLQTGEELQLWPNAHDPVAAILEAARKPCVELLVLTTHGRVVESERHFGRVAHGVAARTDAPVLLVRPEAISHPASRPCGPLRRLLVPLDGTPTTAGALRPATELARRLGAALDLLYVVSPNAPPTTEAGSIGAPRYVDQPRHEWPAWRDRVIDHLSSAVGRLPSQRSIRVLLSVGDIASEIARCAAEQHSDAIVLVRRSRLEVGRARVLRAVLDRTPCPVLLMGCSPH